jgi:hypothetical protein
MRLQPRHYVLFAAICGIFIFNMVRNRQHQNALRSSWKPSSHVITGTPAQTPAWQAFDHAAGLRDAPETDFGPALDAVQQKVDAAPHDPANEDVKGCLIWLEFYRQGMAQTHADPKMKDRALHHLEGCTKYHLDTIA